MDRIIEVRSSFGKDDLVSGRSRIAEWRQELLEDLVKPIVDTRTDAPKILR